MKTLILILSIIIQSISPAVGQEILQKTSKYKFQIEESLEKRITQTLDSLLQELRVGKISDKYISKANGDLTKRVLHRYIISPQKKSEELIDQTIYLINLYPIEETKSIVTLSHTTSETENPELLLMYSLIADVSDKQVSFANPITYYTRFWKQKQIGRINYHFRDTINLKRARNFDQKNEAIAMKLGVEPEYFDFYMTYNEQEVLKLLGIDYSTYRNGQTRNGFGVYVNIICAIMNNEDFSHDVFHYYSGKINKTTNRNLVAEEGIAYAWGNAYYTDAADEMITQERLVSELKKLLSSSRDINLYEWFKENPKVLNHLATEISVRSTIASVLVREVERIKGLDGVMQLINSGRENAIENFLSIIDQLLMINDQNFHNEVRQLIEKY